MNNDWLFSKIKSEIDNFETTVINQNPSFCRLELQRLNLIDSYMASKFRDGDMDSSGQLMVFYNIVTFPVEIAYKMLNFGTKDITLVAQDERYWETWFMEKELWAWLEESKFGRQMKEYTYRLPRDGHIVVKKVDGEIQLVPLKNLRFRPDALSLAETPIIEKYEYYPDQFVKEAKERGWENWQFVELNPEKLKDKYLPVSSNKINIFGVWFPEGWLTETKNNYFIVSYDGHILAYWGNQELFYKDLPWEKVEGRLLGKGNVEKLFHEQIYLNRIANYKASGLNWTSKHLWQTRDFSFNKNLMGNSEDGDVFITTDSIVPVPMEERNLSFYAQEENRWEEQAMRRVFTTEPITGARAPSGTPLGSSILQTQMTTGFYDQKRENLASFIKEILEDWVIPDFKKSKSRRHKVLMRNLLSSDKGAEKIFQMNLNQRLNIEKMRKFMTPEVIEIKKAMIAESLKQGSFDIPDNFYDNLKYKMKIVIQGEGFDRAGKSSTLQFLLSALAPNPQVLENPTIKNIIFEMLNVAGFSPRNLMWGDEEIPTLQKAGERARGIVGGSIGLPSPPPIIPQTIREEVRV